MLVTLAGASEATLTVRLMGGYFAPGASASVLAQVSVARAQVQPVPPIAVTVSLAGSVSIAVTVPLVAPPPALPTEME